MCELVEYVWLHVSMWIAYIKMADPHVHQ